MKSDTANVFNTDPPFYIRYNRKKDFSRYPFQDTKEKRCYERWNGISRSAYIGADVSVSGGAPQGANGVKVRTTELSGNQPEAVPGAVIKDERGHFKSHSKNGFRCHSQRAVKGSLHMLPGLSRRSFMRRGKGNRCLSRRNFMGRRKNAPFIRSKKRAL